MFGNRDCHWWIPDDSWGDAALSMVAYPSYRRNDAWRATVCRPSNRAGEATERPNFATKSGENRGRHIRHLRPLLLLRENCRTLSSKPRLSRQESIFTACQHARRGRGQWRAFLSGFRRNSLRRPHSHRFLPNLAHLRREQLPPRHLRTMERIGASLCLF